MTSKGVSSGPSTREVYKSGPPPSPLYISQLRDTDDDDNVSSHEGDVDGSEDPVSYGPLEKRRRISPPDGGDVHLVSHDLVDHAGEPLFDPSFMVHPNSKEWYPSEHVADYVSFFLRHPLDKAARNKLKSECPRPSLPDNITATPVIDPNMLMFFSKFGKDPKKGVDRAWSGCQDKLLDLVGPLTRIFDLVEEAKMDSNPIDPEDFTLTAQPIRHRSDSNQISADRRSYCVICLPGSFFSSLRFSPSGFHGDRHTRFQIRLSMSQLQLPCISLGTR
ncbi:hypothetical protein NDU88_000907 [Pleurodeles waltl]|uniref:Uncharacterized protein n=1 Tax=Pleurodeles waltl TaxID=8319 RepID=A0AAV7U8X3_PLEWA|nr:hypothetical protein NDU88_000907 [Pleurodeles waltl]